MADFELVARRSLTHAEHRLFRFHHILGASEWMCAKRLGVAVVTINRAILRLEAKLGVAFAMLEPYALYPLYDYFNRSQPEPVKPCRLPVRSRTSLAPRLSVRQQRHQLIA